MMHDTTLRQALDEALARDPALDATHVGVAVGDGIVELTGHVRTEDERLAARFVARRVPGVRVVVDALEVARADDAPRDDVDIAHDILRVYRTVSTTPPGDLQAEVRRGVVTLRGTLDAESARLSLESRIGELAGVRMVSSLFRTAPGTRKTG